MIDYEAQQVSLRYSVSPCIHDNADSFVSIQNKQILERTLPDALKLAIAQKIENNLFSKVCSN
jgi:hypothetical protein